MPRSILLLVGMMLVGCAEEPPGNLRAVSSNQGFSPADTVTARLLGRELSLGTVRGGQLDSTERAWLQDRGYEMVRRRVDSTATHYFRARAERLPRWDKRTLMIERVYVRRPDRAGNALSNTARAAGREPSPDRADPLLDSASAQSSEADSAREHDTEEPVRRSGSHAWTIVVGSVTDSASARTLLASRRERLSATALRVRLRVGTSTNTVRYRVVVGRFDSVAVRQAIEKYRSMLPAGAWPLRLR
ncbi:MAG: SPOR domain-containing protein [Salinibacter sp.]|uniref:SPOR domain-containing protein n=1 Tax=Salinibacter sp. TaxID=2065818 RepID=UPI0035D40D2C